MIHSMTAFARCQSQGDWGQLQCELRSINHRYLEISLHLPETMRELEMSMREHIRGVIKRGKIECVLRYQASKKSTVTSFLLNQPLAQALCHASEEIARLLTNPAAIQPTEILRFPGIFHLEEGDFASIETEILSLLQQTLKELTKARGQEGAALTQLFMERLALIHHWLDQAKEHLPQALIDQRERLSKRFADAKLELDPTRLDQEMLIFAQKIDVAEEIDRIETHIKEMVRALNHGGPLGR